MARIYLDWAASAPPAPDIVEGAARIAIQSFGNPSSAHAEGRAASAILEDARGTLAACLGVDPRQIVFTSGGTESNNIVLSSLLSRSGGNEVIVSGLEHASVHEPLVHLANLGYRVTHIAAEHDGVVDPGKIAQALGSDTAMVAVMHVNNETGAVQPIETISRVVRDFERAKGRPIHFHCDAVQALGKIPADYDALGVDSAAFSAHKLGGLRGAGALYLRRPLPVLYLGGGQESGRRPGTENLPAIWAFAEAARRAAHAIDEHGSRALALKRLLVEGIGRIGGGRFLPEEAVHLQGAYSPYILAVGFPPLPGEVLVRVLDDAGCAVSTGSACSSKRAKERRVLTNMGIDPDTARSGIRISTGYSTTAEDVERFLASLAKEVHTWSTPLRA